MFTIIVVVVVVVVSYYLFICFETPRGFFILDFVIFSLRRNGVVAVAVERQARQGARGPGRLR
jgi:hypothetical protein